MRVAMREVSNMYPKGIQLRNRSRVSNVAPTREALDELSWNIENTKLINYVGQQIKSHLTNSFKSTSNK